MKKYTFLFLILFTLFLNKVSANNKTTEVNKDELLAECHYEYTSSGNNSFTDELILYIFKDYTILPVSNNYKFTYTDTSVESTITYENYLVDKKLDCNNINQVFLNLVLEGPLWEVNNYFVDLNQNDHKTNTNYKENPFPRLFSLNKEKSKVYEENYDIDKNKNEDWIYTCHYGKYYLSFNTQTFETNAYKIDTGKTGTIVTGSTSDDIMKTITDNAFSCPESLCITTTQIDNTYIHWSFANKKIKGCIPVTITTGTYKCGAINTLSEKYNSIIMSDKTPENLNFNKIVQQAKSFCQIAYSNYNYDDPNNCIIDCQNFIERLNTDLNLNPGQCGISKKLAFYIANIVKWLKYIIPVIVIVLGILDFIKAIGADKDDEMKKAQGKFVKRLIAAALIFIVPFIIEFVLDKMGFGEYVSGCGIIDL